MPHDLLPMLRERVRRIERPTAAAHGALPCGVAAIDRVLPGCGLARGALHEILGADGDEEDCALAAAFAAGLIARLVANAGGIILWCSARPDLYGPGLAAHGLDPSRLVLVRAARDAEILWAIEEGLAASGVAAVVGEIGTLPNVASRRLQLAAERSGVTAFALRRWRNACQATRERNLPNAAATRWRITALPSRPVLITLPMSAPDPNIRHPRASIREGIESAADHHSGMPVGVGQVSTNTALPREFSRPCAWLPGSQVLPAPRNDECGSRGDPGAEMSEAAVPDPSPGLIPGSRRGGAWQEPGVGRPRWRVELLRCRGGRPGCWEVEIEHGTMIDATDTLSMAATLADRTPAQNGGALRPLYPIRRTG
jgi:protein ImuA